MKTSKEQHQAACERIRACREAEKRLNALGYKVSHDIVFVNIVPAVALRIAADLESLIAIKEKHSDTDED